jgi:chloramphenicol-sensitive protein RarD
MLAEFLRKQPSASRTGAHDTSRAEPMNAAHEKRRSRLGILYGIAAYGSWGVFPLYFEQVGFVSPLEILAHRIIWSFLILAVMVAVLGRWKELLRELQSPKLLGMLGLSTLLIAANWLVFIYAVTNGHVLQASLGYFVNPLLNVLLGFLVFRERLRPLQTLSIVLALAGVLVLAIFVGDVPWIAASLAVTFSLYGLMRKIMPVDGLVSLTVETLVLTPVALFYLTYLSTAGRLAPGGLHTLGLLVLSGPVTTLPLLFFGAAARRLRLSTMGVLQYLSPTLQFMLAVLVFRERFYAAHIATFACIWTGIVIYTVDSLRAARQARLALVEPFGGDP